MTKESEDAVMKAKEEMVLNYVNSISKVLQLQRTPPIIFCDGYTSEGPNAIACIDIISCTIQVSRIHLQKQRVEEIKKTVAHEITHLIVPDHTPEFYKILNEILAGTWQPEFSTGLVFIDGGAEVELSTQETKKESHPNKDMTYCNYHLCREKTKLLCCPYCKDYFCLDHIKPMPPIFPNFDYPNKFNEQKNRDTHHPCPSYYDHLVKKIRKIY